MKVLHLDTGREWRGGQQQVLHLTRGLEDAGITSVVATPTGSPIADKLRAQGLPLVEIPYASHFAPRTIQAVQKILADQSWDILHMHTSHAHTLGFLSIKLPPRKPFVKPAFIVSRRVDFIPNRDPLSRLKYTAAGQHFICVSEAVREILVDYGIPGKSLHVVHSGVTMPNLNGNREPLRRQLRQELGVEEDTFLLGTIGNFVPHKGHRHFVEAIPAILRSHPEIKVVFIGHGELERELRALVTRLSLDHCITFVGQKLMAARFVPAFDLYVHPSVEEGLGTSILDASAAGIPVVATRAGGIPETILDGETGVLVPPGRADELSRAIVWLIGDAESRRTMGVAATEWIRRSRTERVMVEKTVAAYREILGRPRIGI